MGQTFKPIIALALSLAAFSIFVALLVPVSSVSGGGVTLEGWWVAQFGLAVAVAVLALRASWRSPALLGALFLLGTAAQLALTSPLWLQYLEMRPGLLAEGLRPLACALLMLQTVVVGIGIRRHVRGLLGSIRKLVTRRALVGGPLLFLFAAAHATIFYPHRTEPRYLAAYAAQLAVIAFLFCLSAAHLWLFARSLPSGALARASDRLRSLVTLPGEVREATRLDRRIPYLLAGLVFLLAILGSVFVFERVPHIPDEVAYIFQARQFADGVLFSPAPPVPEAFEAYIMPIEGSRWFTTTNPGWAGFMAGGAALGATWLVNPILGALCILLLHPLLTRLLDRGSAHVGCLLAAVSPWLVFLSSSHMTQPLTLFLALGAALLLLRAVERRSMLPALFAGLGFGYLVLTRPLDGLVAGGLMGAWLLFRARAPLKVLAPYVLGCVAAASLLPLYNQAMTGSPFSDPMNVYLDELWYPGANRLGFGADIGNVNWGNMDPNPGHGLPDMVLNANQNVYNLNFELHGWAVGSLALVAAHLLLGRLGRSDKLFLFATMLLVAAYSCYWFSGGPDFGPRYWFLLFLPMIFWSVRGISTLARLLRERLGEDHAGPRVAATVLLLTIVSVTTFSSWRAVARYNGYRGYHDEYLELLEAGGLGRALVLVDTDEPSEFGSALFLNRAVFREDEPIFAKDLGPEGNRRLRAAFPDRPIVRIRGRAGPGERISVLPATKEDD